MKFRDKLKREAKRVERNVRHAVKDAAPKVANEAKRVEQDVRHFVKDDANILAKNLEQGLRHGVQDALGNYHNERDQRNAAAESSSVSTSSASAVAEPSSELAARVADLQLSTEGVKAAETPVVEPIGNEFLPAFGGTDNSSGAPLSEEDFVDLGVDKGVSAESAPK